MADSAFRTGAAELVHAHPQLEPHITYTAKHATA